MAGFRYEALQRAMSATSANRGTGASVLSSLLIWALAALPSVLLTLHSIAILPLWWQTVPLASFQPHQGFAYIAQLDTAAYPPMQYPADLIYEDGRPARFPNMPGWGVVATQGDGRFHISQGIVFMSASDNSDPRSNGRSYAVVRPFPIPRHLLQASWALAVVGTIGVFWWLRRHLQRFLLRPPFLFVAACLFVLVAANRAWLFLDYPLMAIHPDSFKYYEAAEQIGIGEWPNFGIRPPVYPLFLWSVFSIVDRAVFLGFCQTALSFVAGLLLTYSAYRWKPVLALPAVAVIALYLFGLTTMEHDSAMLSESVYASCLMLSFAGLIIGLRDRQVSWLAWASMAMALAILTRPAGMFLIVTYGLVIAWLLWRRVGWGPTMAFLIPFPLLLVAMSIYNQHVADVFSPTTWGEANLAVATFLYWETDPSYPPEINADIKRIREIIAERHVVTKQDATLLDRSWDPAELSPVFVNSFNGPALDIAMKMGGGRYETADREWIRRVAFDSIRKHPVYYSKFVASMLYLYFKPAPDDDFRVYLQNRAWLFYVARHYSPEKGKPFMVRLGKEFATEPPPPTLIITEFDPNVSMNLSERILIPPTVGWRVYNLTHLARRALFESWAWSICVFVSLIASLVVLVRTRLRHDGAFVLFIITISAVGASLVVSLVEYSQPRYSYPMEWVYGMSAVLLPLLSVRSAPSLPDSHTVRRPHFAIY